MTTIWDGEDKKKLGQVCRFVGWAEIIARLGIAGGDGTSKDWLATFEKQSLMQADFSLQGHPWWKWLHKWLKAGKHLEEAGDKKVKHRWVTLGQALDELNALAEAEEDFAIEAYEGGGVLEPRVFGKKFRAEETWMILQRAIGVKMRHDKDGNTTLYRFDPSWFVLPDGVTVEEEPKQEKLDTAIQEDN